MWPSHMTERGHRHGRRGAREFRAVLADRSTSSPGSPTPAPAGGPGRLVVFPAGIFLAGMAAALLLGMLPDRHRARLGLAVIVAAATVIVSNDPRRTTGEVISRSEEHTSELQSPLHLVC